MHWNGYSGAIGGTGGTLGFDGAAALVTIQPGIIYCLGDPKSLKPHSLKSLF